MAKQKKPPNLKTFLIPRLRRISFMWPHRGQALKNARVGRGQYQCNICKGIFKNKEIVLDHVDPIVPVEGWDNWDGVLNRMFCDVSGFQVICKADHDLKTEKEDKKRKK